MSNERGVSEVLGAILVFALVLAVLVIIQVAGVPAANQQIEFEHNARVQADFQEFDQNVDRAAALGAESSSSLESGVRYPPRLFLINPGPAAGTVTTSAASPVEFRNVKAVNVETNDYFNGTVPYTTTTLSYGPSYNEYDSAPRTTYEHGVLYNSDDNGAAVFANGNLISGNRISLAMLDGNISESSTKSVTLQTVPLSGPSQTVSVQGAQGNDLELEVYTDLSENTWRDRVLADELVSAGGHVTGIDCPTQSDEDLPCNDQLVITLQSGVTYDVRLAKVGIGSGATEESAAYLTKPSTFDPEINLGGTSLIVQVRDRFNNPVSGETVEFNSTDGKFVLPNDNRASSIAVVSDENGDASAVFVPSLSDKRNVNITATAEFDGTAGTATQEKVVFRELSVDTTQNVDSTEGDSINPTGDGFVEQRGTRLVDAGKTIEVDFQNQVGASREIVQARINFYSIAGQSGSDVPVNTTMGSNVTSATDELEIAGDYEILTEKVSLADDEWVTLRFTDWQTVEEKNNGDLQLKSFNPSDKDFFVLTLWFSDGVDADGNPSDDPDERSIYFVGARK